MHRTVRFGVSLFGTITALASAGNAEPLKAAELPHYDFAITLSPDSHRLSAEGTVDLPPASAVRESVEFVLRGDMKNPMLEVVAPSSSAGRMELKELGEDAELKMTKRWSAKFLHPLSQARRCG